MKWALVLVVFSGCATTPAALKTKPRARPEVLAPPLADHADQQAAIRAVVAHFVTAAEAGRFDEVLALLARPLRDRYSVERLSRDFGADPLSSARLAQIKAKSSGPFAQTQSAASLDWSTGRSLRLIEEPEGWRIFALE